MSVNNIILLTDFISELMTQCKFTKDDRIILYNQDTAIKSILTLTIKLNFANNVYSHGTGSSLATVNINKFTNKIEGVRYYNYRIVTYPTLREYIDTIFLSHKEILNDVICRLGTDLRPLMTSTNAITVSKNAETTVFKFMDKLTGKETPITNAGYTLGHVPIN